MLRAFLVTGLLLLSACTVATSDAGGGLALHTQRIELNPEDRAQRALGGLIWRGGLELSARHKDFGGISGILLSDDGTRLVAVTDRGHWFTALLDHDAAGAPTGLRKAALAPMLGPDGKPLGAARLRDAESLATTAGGVLVSFERAHRLLRYPVHGFPDAAALGTLVPEPVAVPDLSALGNNTGLEALTTLADDSLLAISEGRDDSDTPSDNPSAAWRRNVGGAWQALSYPRDSGFRPTGAATLPSGDVLVIERRFTMIGGVAARLRRVPAAAAAAGDLSGETLAEIIPPVSVDNMEAVATRTGAAGQTLVYLLSDDNFNALQRTLLLVFELRGS